MSSLTALETPSTAWHVISRLPRNSRQKLCYPSKARIGVKHRKMFLHVSIHNAYQFGPPALSRGTRASRREPLHCVSLKGCGPFAYLLTAWRELNDWVKITRVNAALAPADEAAACVLPAAFTWVLLLNLRAAIVCWEPPGLPWQPLSHGMMGCVCVWGVLWKEGEIGASPECLAESL